MSVIPRVGLMQHKQLTVMLPDYEEITIDYYVSNEHKLTVRDLKFKIQEVSSCGIDPRRIRLVRNMEELDDRMSVLELEDIEQQQPQEYASNDAATRVIHVVYKMAHVSPESTLFSYDSFIRSMEPLDDEILVSITSSFNIIFGPNEFGHVIRMSSLLDADHHTLQPQYSGDLLHELKMDAREAAEAVGFRQWTDTQYSERVMLVEVYNAALDIALEEVRYSVDGVNGGYFKGDKHSWQRYTDKNPIECKFTVKEITQEVALKTATATAAIAEHGGDHAELEAAYNAALRSGNKDDTSCLNRAAFTDHYLMLKIQPYLPLQYETNYALVLCNNVPTVPVEMFDSPWMSFTVGGTSEDKVVLFRTVSAPSDA